MANGNAWMLKTAIGFGLASIVGAQTFAGNAIWANREKNIEEHQVIQNEMLKRDEKIISTMHKFDIRQEVLISEVKNLSEKL